MAESIGFDRAAGIYDTTRVLEPGVAEKITEALLAEIAAAGADRVLEAGIGTGRMARPLMEVGVRMVGVDISRPMLAKLREQLTPAHASPDLLLGDATALPFRDGAFRAALVVHVLHLVASVEAAVSEIRRVLAPGGVLLQQTRRADPETQRIWDDSDEAWERLLAARGFTRRHRPEQPEVRRRILATGAQLRLVDVVEDETATTVDEEIERLRTRTSSWTWQVPDDIFDDALPEYEAWLRARVPGGVSVDRTTKEIEVWTWPA